MNDIERAIESCKVRHGIFLGDYQRHISDAHRQKLEKQMKLEQIKISALEKQIPKPPKTETYNYGTDADGNRGEMRTDIFCLNCECQLDGEYEYCPSCGQHLLRDEKLPFEY